MTDVEEGLDLSVLARVAPEPEQKPEPPAEDTKPGKARGAASSEGERARTRRAPKVEAGRRPEETPLFEYKPGILVKPIRDFYVTVGMMAMPFHQPIATSIAQNAEECAKAWDQAARLDPKIRKYLLSAMQGSVWVPVAIAHLPILTVAAASIATKKRPEPEIPVESGSTVNPVSNGYRR